MRHAQGLQVRWHGSIRPIAPHRRAHPGPRPAQSGGEPPHTALHRAACPCTHRAAPRRNTAPQRAACRHGMGLQVESRIASSPLENGLWLSWAAGQCCRPPIGGLFCVTATATSPSHRQRCACVSMSMHTCVFACMCARACMRACVHAHIHASVHVCVHAHIHVSSGSSTSASTSAIISRRSGRSGRGPRSGSISG